MKTTIFTLFSALIFLASCGEDNITNNNGGNPPGNNILLSVDSLVLTMQPQHPQTIYYLQNYNLGDSLSQIQITFDLQSNFDNWATGGFECYIMTNHGNGDTTFLFEYRTFSNSIDTSYNYNTAVNSITDIAGKFWLNIQSNTFNQPKYIRFKNIKVTKVS